MKYFIALLLLIMFVLQGCTVLGVAPETNNQKLLQVKLIYSEILDTALKYQLKGWLSASAQKSLADHFSEFQKAEGAAQAALFLSDQVSFDNQLSTMKSVIIILQTIIDTTDQSKGVNYNGSTKHTTGTGPFIRLPIRGFEIAVSYRVSHLRGA